MGGVSFVRATIAWLNSALAGTDQGGGMDYYKVNGSTVSATDGLITACAPWRWGGKFFVPGSEFEKILKRLPDDPVITTVEGGIKIKSGRFNGTIQALPLEEWAYPGMDKAKWKKIPVGLLDVFEALRPFVSENDSPAWANCIALEGGWAYATNNIVIAGAACVGIGATALLPMRSIDFVLSRAKDLVEWTWDDAFVAFRWANGSWMRSQLIVGRFPEKAAAMVRSAHKAKATQKIDDKFREAFERVAELAEDTVAIYAKKIESKFGKAVIEEGINCEIPKGAAYSSFGSKFLVPALKAAHSWSPSVWPEPVPFRGDLVSGYIVGRRA